MSPCHSAPSARGTRGAFTLLEILVAMTILAVLSLFVSQIVGATHSTISIGNRLANTDADARLAFNRLALDLSALCRRTDVDFAAGNPSATRPSDLLVFLSGVASASSGSASSSSGGNRSASLVAYRIGTATGSANRGAGGAALPCLLRAGKALGWSTVGFAGLKTNGLPVRFGDTSGSQAFPAALLPSDSDFDVLAPGVVKMLVGFQLYPDNNAVTLENGTTLANAQGQIVYSPPIIARTPASGGTAVNYVDLSRIGAILVGLVVVDGASLKLLSPGDVAAIAGRFGTPVQNTPPVLGWKAALEALVPSLTGSVPLPALQSVRLYEAAFPVTLRGESPPSS